jgi:HEAT repeat protein
MKDERPFVRMLAGEAIGRVDDGSEAALPALIEALGDPDLDVRVSAIGAIGRIGTKAENAVMPLMDFVEKSKDRLERGYAVIALGRIGPKAFPILPRLEALAADPDEYVRESIKDAVANIRSPGAVE